MRLMSTVPAAFVLVLAFACKSGPKEPPAQPAAAPSPQTPAAAEPTTQVAGSVSGGATATLLVKELPAGTEGMELRDNGLAVSDGYELSSDGGGKFSVKRKRDGQSVASGGCGCTGGTCEPTATSGGIIVCSGSSCTDTCGLALTTEGIRTEIAKF